MSQSILSKRIPEAFDEKDFKNLINTGKADAEAAFKLAQSVADAIGTLPNKEDQEVHIYKLLIEATRLIKAGQLNHGLLKVMNPIEYPQHNLKSEYVLQQLKLPLSPEVNLQSLTETRIKFMSDLNELRHPAGNGQNVRDVALSQVAIIQWANFFFGDLMSDKTLSYVNDILKSYKEPGSDKNISPTAAYARAQAENMPCVFKNFALSWAEWSELQTRPHLSFKRFKADHNVMATHNAAVTALESEPECSAWLRERNYTTVRGRGWKSLLRLYFLENVWKVDPQAWNTMMHSVAPIHRLVEAFGAGILLLIPKDARSKLNHLTIVALDHVIPIFIKHCPDFVYAVEILTCTLYDKIATNDEIPDGEFDVSTANGSFLAKIQAYLDPNYNIERSIDHPRRRYCLRH